MSMTESEASQGLQAQPEKEPGAADWAFPECYLNNDAISIVDDKLPDNSWFRLLILLPSNDIWAPIQCELRAFKRSDMRSKYEALSYAWKSGDPKKDWWESEAAFEERTGR
jgi:hypothetical protein